MATNRLEFEIAGRDAGASRTMRDVAGAADLAATGARLLAESLDKQRRASDASAGASLTLAKADRILKDAEDELSGDAEKAALALRMQADEADKAKRANEELAASQKLLSDRTKTLADKSVIGGPGWLAAIPLAIPLATSLAGAVTAIGVSFGAAAVGAGLFGAMASNVLTQASQGFTKLQALNKQLNAATTDAQKKAVRQQIAALEQGWTPAFRQVMGDVNALDHQWKALSVTVAAPVLVPWLDVAKRVLPDVEAAAKPVAAVFQGWGQTLDQYFTSHTGSDEIRRLAAEFGNFSATQLSAVGTSVGDIAHGVANLAHDVGGGRVNFEAFGGDLVKWGDAFLTWSQSQAARRDVHGFLKYMRDNGHLLVGDIKDLAHLIPGIFAGTSAAGTLEMKALSGFLGFVAKLPPSWGKPLTEVAGAMFLLSKTGVLKVGINLVGTAAKLITGGSLTLGGGVAAGEIRAAFTTGGAAAAGEIRAAMTGGVAAGEGSGLAGGAAAGGALRAAAAASGLVLGGVIAASIVKSMGDHLAREGSLSGVINKWMTGQGGANPIGSLLGGFIGRGVAAAVPHIDDAGKLAGAAIKSGVFGGMTGFVSGLSVTLLAPFQKSQPHINDSLRSMVGDVTKAKQAIANGWTALHGPLGQPFDKAVPDIKSSLGHMQGDVYAAKGNVTARWGQLADDLHRPFRTATGTVHSSLRTMESDVYGAKQRINRDWQGLHGKRVTVGVDLKSYIPSHIKQPGFAAGTSYAPPGWRVVGERGPELEYSPRGGETILPNHHAATRAALAAVPGFAAGAGVAFAPPVGSFLRGFNRAFSRVEDRVAQIARQMFSIFAGFGGGGGGGGYNPGYAAEYAFAKSLFPHFGWSQAQWPSLFNLWQGESGWNPNIQNASSGAAGIPQDITGNFHGGYRGQIIWGENYIAGRYGSPAAAYGAWLSRSPHWYGNGLDAVFNKRTLIGVGDGGAERVRVEPVRAGRGGGGGEMHVHVHVDPVVAAVTPDRRLGQHIAEHLAPALLANGGRLGRYRLVPA